MNKFTQHRDYLTDRLDACQMLHSQGVIPGQCDTLEWEHLKGQIHELGSVLRQFNKLFHRELIQEQENE